MSEEAMHVRDAAQRVFSGHLCTDAGWPAPLWQAVEEVGLDRALVPESAGGAGLDWFDAASLLQLAGEHGAAIPLIEAMIGHFLLAKAGAAVQGRVTIAASKEMPTVRLNSVHGKPFLVGTLHRVPWGRACAHVATVIDDAAGPQLVVLDCGARGVSIADGANLAGEPRDTLALDGVAPVLVVPSMVDAAMVFEICAVARSAQIAGAVGKVLALSVEYANLRQQFGRPIGKFQAIQQMIAVLATQAMAVNAAAQAGAEALDSCLPGQGARRGQGDESRLVTTASAKIRAGEAAGQACAIAHQVFGAIGFTEEHELHRFTKRLWSWREEFGNEAYWSQRLGEHIAQSPTNLWHTITAATAQNEGRPDHEHA